MKKLLAIFAFAILCAPCFAQHHKRNYSGTSSIGTIAFQPIKGSRCEQMTTPLSSICTDVTFIAELSDGTGISFHVGVWEDGKKEFLEELDIGDAPVYLRTVAQTNIFSGGWTQAKVDTCREAILTAMVPGVDFESIVKRGCE